MADTNIEWTDRVWNPTRGCERVSPGCVNCYAEPTAHRFAGPGRPYEGLVHMVGDRPQWTGTVRTVPDKLTEPLHWRKPCKVFVNSMSDLFHDDVPDEFIVQCFAVMLLTQRHTYQVLTKRPERMRRVVYAPNFGECVYDMAFSLSHEWCCGGLIDGVPETNVLPNVWLGVSVEDQQRADERIPLLLQTPAAVRFLSVEPLLGPVDLAVTTYWDDPSAGIHWVIIGGESGHGARRCELSWIRSIVRQCHAASVPCFVKQLGAAASDPENGIAGAALVVPEEAEQLVSLRLRDRKGGDFSEFPEDLKVREFPRG